MSSPSDSIVRAFGNRFLPDEQVVWTGRPDLSITLRTSDLVLLPIGMIWTALALLWEFIQFLNGGSGFYILWGIPFILIGMYLLLGRVMYRSLSNGGTFYAVTDRRILSLTKGWNIRLREMDLKERPTISVEQKRRYGRVTFSLIPPEKVAGGPLPRHLTFDDLKDAGAVAEVVRGLLNAKPGVETPSAPEPLSIPSS